MPEKKQLDEEQLEKVSGGDNGNPIIEDSEDIEILPIEIES